MCYKHLKVLAGVAQLVEQLIRNQQAGGSNPPVGSINIVFWFQLFYVPLAI